MEDEEYIPENSDLRVYLESLKLCETNKESSHEPNEFNLPVKDCQRNRDGKNLEFIDRDVIDQIEELLSARMLFEEDLSALERLLSNFKIVKTGMLRSIFENVSGFIVIVLGLCVYWVIGSYVFFIISLYYAYNAADYLWKKHFNQKRIKLLTEVLTSNFILFRKTLKFIDDSDNILKSDDEDSFNYPNALGNGCKLYLDLKQDFVDAEKEIISILTKATKTLVQKLPFYEYVENPYNYLCYRHEEYFSECIDIKKLYQVYLLVQSEFLQRLALSLIPNLKVAGKDNNIELYKIIKETSLLLRRLERKFNKKFKFVFLRGIYDSKSETNVPFSKKIKSDCNSQYKSELLTNIQDMSNSFQRLLIRSRTIEDNFSNENCSEKMENELTDIQNELNICQRNVSDSFIVLKKYMSKTNSREQVFLDKDGVEEVRNFEANPCVDITAGEEELEDEVFEAYFASDSNDKNLLEEDFDFEDHMKKKMEREYSKLVLEELKTKISEKAKIWDSKQAKNKDAPHLTEDDCPEEKDAFNEVTNNKSSSNVEGEACCNTAKHVPPYLTLNNCTDFSSKKDYEDISFPNYQAPDSNFLNSIFETRNKLLKSPISEELFYDSEDDSDHSN